MGVERPSPFFDRVHSKRATYHGRTKNKELADGKIFLRILLEFLITLLVCEFSDHGEDLF